MINFDQIIFLSGPIMDSQTENPIFNSFISKMAQKC